MPSISTKALVYPLDYKSMELTNFKHIIKAPGRARFCSVVLADDVLTPVGIIPDSNFNLKDGVYVMDTMLGYSEHEDSDPWKTWLITLREGGNILEVIDSQVLLDAYRI